MASEEEIKAGKTTDIYFLRTVEIIKKKRADKIVSAEVTAQSLPDNWEWAVFSGLEEVVRLFEGVNVDLYAMPEGTVFREKEPVIRIEGFYTEFAVLETPLLGFICQASGISTRAARCKLIAWGKAKLLSFGARRMHPAISPMIDRAAYIGGLDGFSTIGAEKLTGERASGTMPHSLILIFGDQVKAWKAFDEVMPEEVPRICLCDTLWDEKIESLMAAKEIRPQGVRLDTPSSRRGDMREIVKEVRWELDLRGYKDVKIFVSGGIKEKDLKELIDAGAEGFGIGTWVSNAPSIDFALDIVEVEGKAFSKRGKASGKKQVWVCENQHRLITSWNEELRECPRCGSEIKPLLRKYIEGGEIVEELPPARKIREYVLEQLKSLRETNRQKGLL